MKRMIVMIAGLVVLAGCLPALAAQVVVGEDDVTIGFLKEKQEGYRFITVGTASKEYIEVKTENNVVYRIYPCGRLEKMEWKTLNPNEDKPTFVLGSTSAISVTSPYDYGR